MKCLAHRLFANAQSAFYLENYVKKRLHTCATEQIKYQDYCKFINQYPIGYTQ